MSTPRTAIYAGGPLYPPQNQTAIKNIGNSGFTTVVAFALHFTTDGELIFNGPSKTLVRGTEYVGPSNWPQQLSSLTEKWSSVDRLLFCIGGAGTKDFPNLKKRIFPDDGDYPNNPQTGRDTALYQKFHTLKQAIPAIDGIDLDDETTHDQPTTVAFAQMLHRIGYDVTFCPYNDADFWVNCLKQLNSETPNLVTGFNLQCYSGGRRNTPSCWIQAIERKMGSDFDAKGFVYPGLFCRHGTNCEAGKCPSEVGNEFHSWKESAGIEGGFLWLYDRLQECKSSGVCGEDVDASAYASAINSALETS